MTRGSARRQTRLLAADAAGIAEAAAILRAGGLVAFPTETVYGLGAHALDAYAVQRIFDAKQRPATDPLIVHLAESAHMARVAQPTPLAWHLAEHFWPGPLSLVVPRLPHLPWAVTAHLETVALRVPSGRVARELLAATDLPIAAPSANLFGRPSPTRAEHVLQDLDGRIDAVLDGGPTVVGVESTIVDISSMPPRLLRAGGLAAEAIERVLGVRFGPPPAPTEGPLPAPGLLPTHYAPRTPLVLISGPSSMARTRLQAEVQRALDAHQRVGVLVLDEDRDVIPTAARAEVVGAWSAPETSAARLFAAIRALDAAGLDVIFTRDLADPALGLGRALADRLRRAARQVVDSRD
jgi:L-threonylcarbamoyladenylate synthase